MNKPTPKARLEHIRDAIFNIKSFVEGLTLHEFLSESRSLEKAAEQQWGSKGIYIPETVSFDGLPELPINIAEEMQDLYLVSLPWTEKSDSFDEFASTKSPFQSRWNWKQDKGWNEGKWTCPESSLHLTQLKVIKSD